MKERERRCEDAGEVDFSTR